MRRLISRFVRDQRGATAIEYALLASLLAIVIAAAITALGVKMYNLIGTTTAALH
jgi:pilus assembly protein Flp/PilA